MELGHLLTRSGLTHPEVSSKAYHDSFFQLGSSISLSWVICFEAFYLHVVSSFSCIPVICPNTESLNSKYYCDHGTPPRRLEMKRDFRPQPGVGESERNCVSAWVKSIFCLPIVWQVMYYRLREISVTKLWYRSPITSTRPAQTWHLFSKLPTLFPDLASGCC